MLLDNCSIHKAKATRETADALGIEFIWNVPYKPAFNGIEYVW
jgi:transposase